MKKIGKTTLPDGTILRGFKYRIYPTPKQEEFLKHQFGACRWIWNYFLEKRQKDYQETRKGSSYITDGKLLTQLKKQKEYEWLQNITIQPLAQSLRDLDTAYTNFLKNDPIFLSSNLNMINKHFDPFKILLLMIRASKYLISHLASRLKNIDHLENLDPILLVKLNQGSIMSLSCVE